MNNSADAAREISSRTQNAVIYLDGSGWTLAGILQGDSIWRKTILGNKWDLVFPVEQARPDGVRRASEALEILSAAEDRDKLDIAEDIIHSQEDVLRIKTNPESASGSAPLDEALAIMQAARDALEAAASTIGRPRSVLGPRKPDQASSYAGGMNLSTEPGSFVVALSSPVTSLMRGPIAELATDSPNGTLFNPEVPFTRLANEQAMRAIDQAVRTSEEALEDDPDNFGNIIESGVSANLLESLVRIGTASNSDDILGARTKQYSISMRWAYGRRPRQDTPSNINVSRDCLLEFSRIASEFRRRQPQPDTEIIGQLTGSIDKDVADTGVAVIKTFISTSATERPRWRKVRVALDGSNYQAALRAHADRLSVRVIGNLQTSGTLQMTEVESFEVTLETEDE